MNKEQWKKLYQEHAYLFERFGSFYRIGIGLCIDSLGEDEEIEDFAALNKRYEEWSESKEGKKSNSVILQILSDETDAKIQIGLDSIAKGNYSKTDSRPYLGTYTVQDNETKLWGLITEEGEEILPCIFERIHRHAAGPLEANFKNECFEVSICPESMRIDIESEPINDDLEFFIYGRNGIYMLIDGNSSDDIAQELKQLLKKKHRIKHIEK